MNPKVSIILTSYNKPNLIGKAIESVMNQTYSEWELFIMDDNSNEKTLRIIERYLNDKRIYYFNSQVKDEDRYKTTRYATLINTAMPMTKGEYITYLTDDTEYLPQRLNRMVKFLEENSSIHVVYSGQLVCRVDQHFKTISKFTRHTRGKLDKAANKVDHCSVMHTKKIAGEVLNKYGSYWNDDPKYWHNGDAGFWSRLNEVDSFYPINKVLDRSYKTPHSFQNLNAYLPENIPNGTLVKGLSKDIYLIDNQRRRLITDDMFRRLKYDSKKVVEVPDPFLFKYSLGPEINSTVFKDHALMPNYRLVKTPHSARVYYIENNQKRRFESSVTLRKYRFKLQDAVEVGEEYLRLIPNGTLITHRITRDTILPENVLFRVKHNYFLSQENSFHPISYKVLMKLNLTKVNSVSLQEKETSFFKKGKSIFWKIGEQEKETKWT
ncbi:glycosyltransferase family A protein [Bacillus solitudinis]|uniref:glycosyltransferase family A protein n=1 Tax=Bacillus solitudinis TaxID=2014074 RepID=UPI001D0D0654|nr:glycosyltransferase family 2 protein [Bacillus solitudinis]